MRVVSIASRRLRETSVSFLGGNNTDTLIAFADAVADATSTQQLSGTAQRLATSGCPPQKPARYI